MSRIIAAITPEEVNARRLEKEVADIDQLNRATTMLNGRLGLLLPREELDFSFIREGFGHNLLDALAARYQAAGWDTHVYRGEMGQDFGLIISWRK